MTLTIDDLIQNLIANNNGKKDELITTIEKSANYGYKVAVDKACDWLEQNAYHYCDDIDTLHESALIGDFRHAMKGD